MSDKEKPATSMSVAEAEAAVAARKASVAAFAKELAAAKAALDVAEHDLRAAKVNADMQLPKARMRTSRGWKGGSDTDEVVIVKRTPKQITVRLPGHDVEYSFRRSDSCIWSQYPRPKSKFGSTYKTLEIDE